MRRVFATARPVPSPPSCGRPSPHGLPIPIPIRIISVIPSQRGGITATADLKILSLDSFEPAFPSSSVGQDLTRRFSTLLLEPTSPKLRGGIGFVTKAYDMSCSAVAVKRLAPDQGEGDRQRELRARVFREEYYEHCAVSALDGFPMLYGFGTSAGEPLILMEWVEGVTLRDATSELAVLPDGAIPARTVAALGVAIAATLTSTERLQRPFVHRDLSPRNIMLRTSVRSVAEQAATENFDVCLVDFGSARSTDRDNSLTMVADIWRNGTPEYAPPEMLTVDVPGVEEARDSPSIDVYALCSVLYELYAGDTPYGLSRDHGSSSPYRIKMDRPPEPLRERCPEEEGLVRIIMSGIVNEQWRRPTARALLGWLTVWLRGGELPATLGVKGGTPTSYQGASSHELRSAMMTRRALIAGAAALAVGGAGFVLYRLVAGMGGHRGGADDSGSPVEPVNSSTDVSADSTSGVSSADGAEPTEQVQPIVSSGLWWACSSSRSEWGIIDAAGSWVVEPFPVSTPRPIGKTLSPYEANGLWGYVAPASGSGVDLAITPRFAEATPFSGGIASAKDVETGLWGVIGEDGSWVVTPRFVEMGTYGAGHCAANATGDNKAWGIVDANGTWTSGQTFRGIGRFSEEGLAPAFATFQKWGYVDAAGHWSINQGFYEAAEFSEGFAAVTYGGGAWGYCDESGKTAISHGFSQARPFSEGLAAVQDPSKGLWCFIHRDGQLAHQPSFAALGEVIDGVAAAQDPTTGRWGLADSNGAWVVQPSFLEICI